MGPAELAAIFAAVIFIASVINIMDPTRKA